MPFRIRVFLSIFLALFVLLLIGPLILPIPELEGTASAQSLAGPGSEFAQVEGVTLHYREGGSGEPAFLLLHGYPGNSAAWNAVMPELALFGHTISFDRPGFGLSERPEPGSWPRGESPYEADASVEQAVALLDRLGVESAIWIGSSSGAITAMEAALSHPERVAGLVLVGAPAYVDRSPPAWLRPLLHTPQLNRVGPLLMRQLDADPGQRLFTSQWANPERIDEGVVEGYRLTFAVDDWDRGLWEISKASRGTEVDERLSEIDLPTLVVAGSADAIVPPEESERLARELPDASFALMEGCGHVAHQECPVAFVEVVTGWLADTLEP